MDDLISRRDAIEAIEGITSNMSVCVNQDECHGMKRMQRQAVLEITNLPYEEPEFYDYSDIEPLWRSFAEENDINLTPTAKQLKDALWCGYEKGKNDAKQQLSQVARDIATILENEQDMRVILKNAEIIRCGQCKNYEWDEANDAYHCMEWGYNFPEEDDFCSKAEKRYGNGRSDFKTGGD